MHFFPEDTSPKVHFTAPTPNVDTTPTKDAPLPSSRPDTPVMQAAGSDATQLPTRPKYLTKTNSDLSESRVAGFFDRAYDRERIR